LIRLWISDSRLNHESRRNLEGFPMRSLFALLFVVTSLLSALPCAAGDPGEEKVPTPEQVIKAKPKAAGPAKSQSRYDLFGDPLPPDAIARMGSIRWRHLDQFDARIRVVPSPTGQLVATVDYGAREDAVVRVWNLSDGRPVCELPWEDTVAGEGLQFTPDGSQLLILAPRGVVKLYDPRTGKLVAESKPIVEKDDVQQPTKGQRYSTTRHMLIDGRWVMTQVNYGETTLTEATGDPTTRPRQAELEQPTAHEFSFFSTRGFMWDGKSLMSVNHDKAREWQPRIHRWDARTGRLGQETQIPTGNTVIALSRDGKKVAAWRNDAKPVDDVLRVWDTETGAKAVELEGAHRPNLPYNGAVSFSPDGKRLIAQMDGNKATQIAAVWEVDRGKEVGRVTFPRWCYEFHLLPDGKTILAAGIRGMMFGTWDIATGRRLSPISGHESSLRHLAFTPDGKTLLTASSDPEEWITAWDAATGKKLRELVATHGLPLIWLPNLASPSLVLTPGGAVVTTGNGTLIWTDLKNGRELRRVTTKRFATEADDRLQEERMSLAADPQTGRPLVVGLHSFGRGGLESGASGIWRDVVTLWDAESGELLTHRVYSRYFSDPTALVSPDGRLLARQAPNSPSGTSVVLDSAFSGRDGFQRKQPDDLSPHSLFTPDSQTLITLTSRRPPENTTAPATGASTIRLWEARSGRQRFEFAVPAFGKASRFEPLTFAISPDGRFLAGAWTDKTIHIWDLATGTEVAKRSGYGTIVDTLAFRPDGKALASGHADGTALVWDLSGLPGVKLTATDREAAWKDLASADAGKAYRAILALSADPGGAAFLREKVKASPKIPTIKIRQLVKNLDSGTFATRVAATTALKNLGEAADAELRTLLRGNLPLEQHRRIVDVLETRGLMESDPDRLRALRSVEVLERVGSAEARSVLGELANGASGARLTREAAGAVRRHSMRSR
jgi:WD40 repeat protein